MYYIQWATTFSIMGLLAIGGLCFLLGARKWAFDCVLIAIVLLVTAYIFAGFGIEILSPEVYEFFQHLFHLL